MTSTLGAQAPPGDVVATPVAEPAAAPTATAQADPATLIAGAVQAAPELSTQPAMAVAVANGGGNVALKAQSAVQAGNRQASATAANQSQQSGGLLGFITHGVGDLLHKVAQYANDGLSTVQQEYRYLHDVEARHGRGAAIEEGLGMLAGAAAGTLLDPGEGTILGAEAATRLEGAITYKDSWSRAANPNYRDPHTGQLVSFGRDVSSALGVGGGAGHVISGSLDGLFDLGLDPLANVGKGFAAAHSVEGIQHGLLSEVYTGLSARDPEAIDQAWSNIPSFKRAASQIAGMDKGTIAVRFPLLKPIAGELAAATTAEEVRDTFHDLAVSGRMMDTDRLPTMSLTRTATGKFHEIAANAGDSEAPVVGAVANRLARNKVFGIRTWADRLAKLPGTTFDPEDMDFSGKQFNPNDDRGLTDIYNMARYGNSDRVSLTVTNAFANATPDQRLVIYRNLIFDTLFHMAKMKVPGEADYLAYLEKGDIAGAIARGSDRESVLTELGKGDVAAAIRERMENHLGMSDVEGASPDRQYGFDGRRSIDGIQLPNGAKAQMAITSNQTGQWSIPNLVEARRMAEAIRSTKVHRVLASTDDFLYDHITQGFFKPLVLMSGGYGFHISLAEAIPNTLRHGMIATSKGFYDRALANLGYKADQADGDMTGLAGWLWHMGGERAFRNSEDAQTLANFYVMTGGEKSTAGMGAGDNLLGEINPAKKAADTLHTVTNAVPGRATKDYALFGNTDAQFATHWQRWLGRNADDPWTRVAGKAYIEAGQQGMDEKAATEYARQAVAEKLKSEPESFLHQFGRMQGKRPNAPAAWTPIDDWAATIVENLKGSVHPAPDATGELGALTAGNKDLLDSIANGRRPTLDEVKAIDPIDRPLAAPGRILSPPGGGLVNAIANWGFKKVLDPMVNMISRNQEFAVEMIQARRSLDAMVNHVPPLMSEDEAMVKAAAIATHHSMRFIHNLNDRTQWTATMRNWAPFYFAQEQAYRRMGRLLAEDPGAFRRYQMMIAGVSNYTTHMQDGNGSEYIAFPGSGFVGKGLGDVMGLHGLSLGGISPASFGGSFSSANVIFPLSQGYRPDLGPVAVVPMAALGSLFTELGKTYSGFSPVTNIASSSLSEITGSEAMAEPIWYQLIPNAFVANMVEAFSDDRAFTSSVMQAYQFADYQQAQAMDDWQKGGEKGPPPQLIPAQNASAAVKQAFANKIKNWARALYIARAISAVVSPVSSDVVVNNLGFPQKLTEAIAKAGSVDLGMQNFLLQNPDAVPYTVAQSYMPSDTDSTTPSGYSLSSSDQAQQWITANQGLIKQYGTAAYWLMPQLTDSQYDPTVYNEQIAQGIRVKDTPEQFLNALYVAAGDNLYYAGLTQHENALASIGDSGNAKNAEYDKWNAYVTQLEKQYPVWAESFTSGVRQTTSQQVIQNLTDIYTKGLAPDDAQSSMVEQLLQNYYSAAADYSAAGNTYDYASAQSKVNDNWVQYLDTLELSTPALKPIIQAIFKDALPVQT